MPRVDANIEQRQSGAEGPGAAAGGRLEPGAGWDIVYICDWLPPDFGAIGQYSELFCRDFAAKGQRVALIGLSSNPARRVSEEAVAPGLLRKVTLATSRYDKTAMRQRIAWTARTNTRLLLAAWPYMRRARKIVFTGSPPLFLHWIAPANLLLKRRLVYRIADFHPECAMAERAQPSLFLDALYRLTVFWRRRVQAFEVLGADQARRLIAIGIAPDRIELKPNPSPVTIGPDTAPLQRPAAARDKMLLLYSGNWGVAHDVDTFVQSYRAHYRAGNGRVLLWLNATGIGARRVEQALTELGLPFIRGAPVPLEQLASLLVTPDAHLITLSDAFVGYVLPSKVHGCVESGRPVLFFGSERSDVHTICNDGALPAYWRVGIGDIEAGRQALDALGDGVGRQAVRPQLRSAGGAA
ncbi:MAG TPA: hypothetical protein VE224_18510 [Pseudolabrys sp.]|nr:hypothetical protein [Pseudolabrys sp.]